MDSDGKLVKTVGMQRPKWILTNIYWMLIITSIWIVVDLKALKVFDGIANCPDAQISLTDEDFYLIGTKNITFDELIQMVFV